MTSIGSVVLDEIRETERSVRLLDLFTTPALALEWNVFRVVSDEGVLWETDLVGGWKRDNDRLIEFDRPPKHKIRMYGEPNHRLVREATFRGGARVSLYEMSMSYSDVDVKSVLKEAGVHNLSRLEEEYTVERFIGAFATPKASVGKRWLVYAPVDGGVKVEQRMSAVMGETLFEHVVDIFTGTGAGEAAIRYLVLEGNELARRLRDLVVGIAACTYWDDGTCVEFANVIRANGTRELQESVRGGEKEPFDDFIHRCRTGGDVFMDGVREFVESRAYPQQS